MAQIVGKKVKIMKGRILFSNQGRLLGVVVSEANMEELLGAKVLVMEQAENISEGRISFG